MAEISEGSKATPIHGRCQILCADGDGYGSTDMGLPYTGNHKRRHKQNTWPGANQLVHIGRHIPIRSHMVMDNVLLRS